MKDLKLQELEMEEAIQINGGAVDPVSVAVAVAIGVATLYAKALRFCYDLGKD